MEPHNNQISLAHRAWVLSEAGLTKGPSPKLTHYLASYALLALALITPYLYLSHGQKRVHAVPIDRNAAWNDLIRQITLRADIRSNDNLGRDLVLIQSFLKEHEFEDRVGNDDFVVLSAIDQARARLQKADKDLQMIRIELSRRDY